MRFFIFFILLVATPVVAYGQSLGREHSIQIEVECIETAREIIDGLNGYNLDSAVNFEGASRRATFTRRVDGWAYRHVQEVLRGLGEVTHETEFAQELGAGIMRLDTRILVLSQEMERLTLMMAASDSLDVLIAVNDRLNAVSRERDTLIGQRNVLTAQAESPIIFITITEIPEIPPVPVPVTFGERVSRSFLDSWDATRRVSANLLVFFVRISVPALVWLGIAGAAGLVVFTVRKRRKIKEVQHEAK